jgi:hypothetical protein
LGSNPIPTAFCCSGSGAPDGIVGSLAQTVFPVISTSICFINIIIVII